MRDSQYLHVLFCVFGGVLADNFSQGWISAGYDTNLNSHSELRYYVLPGFASNFTAVKKYVTTFTIFEFEMENGTGCNLYQPKIVIQSSTSLEVVRPRQCSDRNLVYAINISSYNGVNVTYQPNGTFSKFFIQYVSFAPTRKLSQTNLSIVSNNEKETGVGTYVLEIRDVLDVQIPTETLPSFVEGKDEELVYIYRWHLVNEYGKSCTIWVRIRNASAANGTLTVFKGPNPMTNMSAIKLHLGTNDSIHAFVRSGHPHNLIELALQNAAVSVFSSGINYKIEQLDVSTPEQTCKLLRTTVSKQPLTPPQDFVIRADRSFEGQCLWKFKSWRKRGYLRINIKEMNMDTVKDCTDQGIVIHDGKDVGQVPAHGPYCGTYSGTGSKPEAGRIITQFYSSSAFLVVSYHALRGMSASNDRAIIFRAEIEEYDCKGIVLRETRTVFKIPSASCAVFQRLPTSPTTPTYQYLEFQKNNIPFWRPYEFTSAMLYANGIVCNAHYNSYFRYESGPPICLNDTSALSVTSRQIDRIRTMTFMTNSNTSLSFAVKFNFTIVLFSWRIKCSLLPPYRVIQGSMIMSKACGFLQAPRHEEVITWTIMGNSLFAGPLHIFEHRELFFNTVQETSSPSHYDLWIRTTSCLDLKIAEWVSENVHYPRVLTGHPRPTSTFIYKSFCYKSPEPFILKSIAADLIEITYRPYVQRNEALELEYILHPKNIKTFNTNCTVPGYSQVQKACYKLYTKVSTAADARKRCLDDGGDIVCFDGVDEHERIMEMIQTVWKRRIYSKLPYVAIYIGLQADRKINVRWLDGSPLTFTKWYSPGDLTSPYTEELISLYVNDMKPIMSSLKRQPVLDGANKCGLMLVRNPYYEPSWFMVPCNYPLAFGSTICEMKTISNISKDFKELHGFSTPRVCPHGWTYIESACVRVLTSNYRLNQPFTFYNASVMCFEHDGYFTSNLQLDTLQRMISLWNHKEEYGSIWLNKTSYGRCQILAIHDPWGTVEGIQKWVIQEVDCNWVGSDMVVAPLNVLCQHDLITSQDVCKSTQWSCNDGSCYSASNRCDGVSDCKDGEDEVNCARGLDFFRCSNGKYVHMSHFCDFKQDCLDGSDESACSYPGCKDDEFRCASGQCISARNKCDFTRQCIDGSDELDATCSWRQNCTVNGGFLCYSGECLPSWKKWNMVSDCLGSTQEDELFTEKDFRKGRFRIQDPRGALLVMSMNPYCSSFSQARCHLNHPSCYERGDICIFNKNGGHSGCGDLSHLANCEDFECPGMFKCPSSYCVPRYAVCDNVWDCPAGIDELECSNYTCPGKFRCQGKRWCIDQSQVCDGITDCVETGEDERFCDIDIKCPLNCMCEGYVIRCNGAGLVSLPNGTQLMRAIMFSDNKILLTPYTFDKHDLTGVLDLSFNKLRSLPAYAFQGMTNLYYLNLTGNYLRDLGSNAFFGIRLSVLDLRQNGLALVSERTFTGLNHLGTLYLQHNDKFLMIDNAAFNEVNITNLHTDSFRFCCLVGDGVNCTPSSDPFSSCADLMSNYFLRVAVWVLGVSAAVGNIGVLILFWRRQRFLR